MVVVESYTLAVVLCFVTMLCWGSWANTQKLATKEWRFQLFYWDYALGVLLLALFSLLTTSLRAQEEQPLPLKRVVLLSSSVGFFEHEGVEDAAQ